MKAGYRGKLADLQEKEAVAKQAFKKAEAALQKLVRLHTSWHVPTLRLPRRCRADLTNVVWQIWLRTDSHQRTVPIL